MDDFDVRQFISSVRAGRPATRLGSDGIDPWISIPRRYTPAVVELMAVEGVPTSVREHGVVDDDSYGIFVMLDCISFPGADPKLVQSILNNWRTNLG